jgi:hypothetical protein
MLLTLVTTLIVVVLSYQAISLGVDQRSFLKRGVMVDARVVALYGQPHGTGRRDRRHPTTLEFTLPDQASPARHEGWMPINPQATDLTIGQAIRVMVDPTDPKRFSDVLTTRPWVELLSTPVVLLPVLGVCAFVWRRTRAGYLRIWREGVEQVATVADAQRSPVAPGATLLKVSIDGQADRRLVLLTWPNRLGAAPRDGKLPVVVHPSRPGRPIAVQVYQG